MDCSITFLFAKPISAQYHEYAVNTLERSKWIDRDDLRHFISRNFSREIISIAEIKKLVESNEAFIIDNSEKEWYLLDNSYSKENITKVVNQEDTTGFNKIVNMCKKHVLNL